MRVKYLITVPLNDQGKPAKGENPNVVATYNTEGERDENYALLSLDPSHFCLRLTSSRIRAARGHGPTRGHTSRSCKSCIPRRKTAPLRHMDLGRSGLEQWQLVSHKLKVLGSGPRPATRLRVRVPSVPKHCSSIGRADAGAPGKKCRCHLERSMRDWISLLVRA